MKEAVVFRQIENDLLAKMNEMLYMEHVILASVAEGDTFREEIDGAQSKFNTCGRLGMPWLQWAAMKTAAQAWKDAQERRQDPEYRKKLERMKENLIESQAEMRQLVAEEKAMRQRIKEHAEKERKQRRKRHGGLPRRKARPKRR